MLLEYITFGLVFVIGGVMGGAMLRSVYRWLGYRVSNDDD